MKQSGKTKSARAGATAVANPAAMVTHPEVKSGVDLKFTDAEIAARAYSYWQERGCTGGCPEEDWSRAVEELTRERG